MSHTTSHDGPYFSSGQITFSQIRSTFNPSGSSQNIQASTYLRYTDTSLTSPLLPDCTENNAVASSKSNWKTSQLRNTIRFYYVTQYGEETNAVLTNDGPGTTSDGSNGGYRWNGNLPKNIVKSYNETGTCGSNNTTAALTASGTVYNLSMTISGSVLGGAGVGGSPNGGSGGNGGPGLSMGTSGSIIPIRITGRCLGGGGGGGAGNKGADGTSGRCRASTTNGGCDFQNPSVYQCPNPYSVAGSSGGGGCATKYYRCTLGRGCGRDQGTYITTYCTYDQPSTQGIGGQGGSGGTGRGYNNQSGSLGGSSGVNGTCPTCSFGNLNGGTCGQVGYNGGSGGDWGSSGQSANPGGSGGSGAAAIVGSNYRLS